MARSKRSYQWVGDGVIITPVPDVSVSVGGIMQILPALTSSSNLEGRTQVLLEALYVRISTHRVGIDVVDACGVVVWVANVSEGSNNPVQSLDAFSTQSRSYSNKNILILESIAVSPILGAGDLLTAIPSEATLVSDHRYKATRKIDRATQVLFLMVNADVADQVRCFVQVRALLSYGAR